MRSDNVRPEAIKSYEHLGGKIVYLVMVDTLHFLHRFGDNLLCKREQRCSRIALYHLGHGGDEYSERDQCIQRG